MRKKLLPHRLKTNSPIQDCLNQKPLKMLDEIPEVKNRGEYKLILLKELEVRYWYMNLLREYLR